jgi:hypothetical protein
MPHAKGHTLVTRSEPARGEGDVAAREKELAEALNAALVGHRRPSRRDRQFAALRSREVSPDDGKLGAHERNLGETMVFA